MVVEPDGGAPRDRDPVWQEADSATFIEFGAALIPRRDEIERVLLDLVPATPEELFHAVEIGTGAGWLSAALLHRFPGARVVGLDGSPAMLKETATRLAPFGDRVELRPFRLEDRSWPDTVPGQVRCFLSSLVIHHLDGPAKRDLFARLFDRLEPGGALLIADILEPTSKPGRRHMARAWEDGVRRQSQTLYGDLRAHDFFIEERWNIFDHPDPGDRPSPLPDQLRWLEEIGYAGVDAWWVSAGHAVYGGYKPRDGA